MEDDGVLGALSGRGPQSNGIHGAFSFTPGNLGFGHTGKTSSGKDAHMAYLMLRHIKLRHQRRVVRFKKHTFCMCSFCICVCSFSDDIRHSDRLYMCHLCARPESKTCNLSRANCPILCRVELSAVSSTAYPILGTSKNCKHAVFRSASGFSTTFNRWKEQSTWICPVTGTRRKMVISEGRIRPSFTTHGLNTC